MLENSAPIQNVSQTLLSHETPKSIFFKVGKKTLIRQNMFKNYHHDESMKLSVSKLSNQQVLSSQIYTKLAQKIVELEQHSLLLERQHKKKIAEVERNIEKQKQNIHNCKYSVWELKNQIMGLEEVLGEWEENGWWQAEEGEGGAEDGEAYGEQGDEAERQYSVGDQGEEEDDGGFGRYFMRDLGELREKHVDDWNGDQEDDKFEDISQQYSKNNEDADQLPVLSSA